MDDYLTVEQAAAALGISKAGIHWRIKEKGMVAERVSPRLLLIPREEIERWQAMGEIKRGPKKRRAESTQS